MRVRILGDVEVVGPDGAVTALTPLPAAVLCRLLVADGNRVSADTLLADLWADRAPGAGTVRVTVARLRRALESAGLDDRLVTRSGGWSLSIERAETDIGQASALLEQAIEARRRGSMRDARVAASTALGMLSGGPLSNVPGHACFSDLLAEVSQLTDRADAELTECELALGRGIDVVSRCLVRAEVDHLDEAAVSRAVRALVQAGRHAEAVTWCSRHNEALGERGLVASDQFRALELAVLRHTDDDVVARRDPAGTFVGRLEETDRLVHALESTSAGSSVVVVEGVAGIGKTRLVREFCATKVPLTRHVLHGACSPEVVIPFEPFVEALSTSSRSGWSGLLQASEHAADPLLQSLRITDTVSSALVAEMRDSGVLVIDDAQWMDAASVSVLRMVLRTVSAPALVVLIVRTPDDRSNTALAGLLGEITDLTRISLRGLNDDDAALLFGLELGHDSVAQAMDGLGVLSRGNPLLVRTLARATAEAVTGDGLQSDGVLRAAFAPRFARLGTAGTSVIAAAAVLGQRFGLRRLATVADADMGVVLDAVEHAVALDLLATTDRFDEFVFDHDLVRHEALAQVSQARVALFHSRAAEVLLAEQGPDAQVVRHLVDAGSLTDPAHLASVAADAAGAAVGVGALDLAGQLLAIGAETCAPGTATEATLLAVGGAIAGSDGRVPAAVEAFDRAAELATVLGLDRLLALILNWQSSIGRMAESDESLDHIRALCDRLRSAGDVDSLGRALSTLALCLRLGPHRIEARRVAAELREIADRLGTPATRYAAAATEHHMHFVEAAPLAARRASTVEMLDVAVSTGNRFAEISGHRSAVNDALTGGDLVSARESFVRMEAAAAGRAYPLATFLLHAIDIGLRIACDDLDGIDDAIGVEAAVGREHLVTSTDFTVAAHLFTLRWAQGRLDELADVLSVVSTTSDVVAWSHAHALSLHAADRVDEARDVFAAAVERTIAEPVRDWLWLPEALMAAEACVAVGSDDHCARLAAVLVPYADLDVVVAEGSVLSLGPLSRPLAVLLDRAGRQDEARHWAQHAAGRTGPGGAVLWARVGCRLDH